MQARCSQSGGNFKRCSVCGIVWPTRKALLDDPGLKLIGYQSNFRTLSAGLFLFNHTCRGTLAIMAESFRDLYAGPVFSERATGSDTCGGHCLHEHDLGPCPAQCECAYVREILQIIRNWPRALQSVGTCAEGAGLCLPTSKQVRADRDGKG
jgi:hypothetical protein